MVPVQNGVEVQTWRISRGLAESKLELSDSTHKLAIVLHVQCTDRREGGGAKK